MPNTVVHAGSVISYAIVGENCIIEEKVKIGERPEEFTGNDWGISVIGHGKRIKAGTVILPKEII